MQTTALILGVACDEPKLPTQLGCKPTVKVVKVTQHLHVPNRCQSSDMAALFNLASNNDRIGIDKPCPPAATTASRAARPAPSVPPGDGISKTAGGIVSKDIRLR